MSKEKIFEVDRVDLSYYNEYDLANKGGYYICPNPKCGKQQYISCTLDIENYSCADCNTKHIFIN